MSVSVKTTGSTLADIPSVTAAVEHLQELAYRMSEEEIRFSEDDICNIDHVIDSINELEHECRKIHEKLETETIEASIVRHKLQIFPDEIKNQIRGAVNAARDLNSTELTNLRTTLDTTNSNIDSLENRHTVLEKNNAHLHPERSRVRHLHEEVIGHLNKRMSEKASKQIVLNETRDQLREIIQKIEDLEEGILQLKEDLIQERAEARQEKKRLKQVVYDTTVKTRDLKETNLAKKQEIDILQVKVTQSEQKLEEMRKNIRQFENSKSRLESQELALSNQLKREIINNDDLRLRGIDLQQTIQEKKTSFEAKRLNLENSCNDLDAEIDEQIEMNNFLEMTHKKSQEDVLEKMKIRSEDEKAVKAQNAVLQSAKTDLALTAEDAANLRGQNVEMESRILELEETHEAILSTMNKQVDELRGTLSVERKERMALQAKRDDIQSRIEASKNETIRYLNSKTKQMKLDKMSREDLSKEGTALQRKLREEDQSIVDLEIKLTESKEEFEVIKEQHHRDVKGLEPERLLPGETESLEKYKEIFNKTQEMNTELEDKKVALDEQMPNFERLQKYFDERTVDYDTSKKELIGLKNKKMSLEDSVKRVKRDLEKMNVPRNILETDLKKRRSNNLQKMKDDANELKGVESNIYSVGCKYKCALDENEIFAQSTQKLSKNINEMNRFIESNEEAVTELLQQLTDIKGVLLNGWKADQNMDEMFGKRDQEVVEDFTELLHKTEHREQVIAGITDKLHEELGSLSGFLDNLAERRPLASSKMSMR